MTAVALSDLRPRRAARDPRARGGPDGARRPATTAPGSRRRSRSTAGPSSAPGPRRAADDRRADPRRWSSSRTATVIPIVPRAGGTGLNDGAMPLKRGYRRRRQADEPDQGDRSRGPDGHGRARDQHAQAQRGAPEIRGDVPRRPGVVPVLARWRSDRDVRLVPHRRTLRAHPRPGDQLPDRAARRAKPSRSATGAGARSARARRGSSSSTCSWATRARSGSSPRRPGTRSPARGRVRGVLLVPRLRGRVSLHRRIGQVGPGDAGRRRAVRRMEAAVPAPRRRGLHPAAPDVRAVVAMAMYGPRTR